MKKLLTAIIVTGLTACNQPQSKGETKTMDFGAFTIETPNSWKQIKAKGIDSYVGRIAIDSTDTLDFDLGWYSNTLTEGEPFVVERSMLQYSQLPADTSEMIIVEKLKGIDLDRYKKQNVSWDTIDGRKAKLVYPRRSGTGTTGVYIDSLWVSGADVDRFNLYGENLKPKNEKKVLQAIRTLKFRSK
ncbi:hypothetical protein [Flavisolibacter nicotianae]|uniref:hypothetical protein n=1 Tax=Flavisolibacter nicotianae TaxID=2364882 RepID=UPI000EB33A16|nr:hypothetical protein [Flavisolibacter nicotianae]